MPGVCIYQRYMPPDLSGAGKQAVTLARVVREEGWDVTLLADAHHRSVEAELQGYPIQWLDPLPPAASYPQILAYWARVGRALYQLRHRFDVLHVHTAAFEQVGALPVARALRKRVLVRSSISGEFAALTRWSSGRLQRNVLRLADAFVVLSEGLASEYIESGLPRARLNLIPNGVDTSIYHPVSRERQMALRHQLELPAEGRLLVFHGVFIDRKRLHWLVDVLEPCLTELDLTLLLVGGPARNEEVTGYAARLIARIEDSPARERIIVRGHDPEVYRYLQAADCYCLPSTGEGLPNALLEAMASGLVCFVSRTSGSADVVADRVSGFLFAPEDGASLIAALRAAYGATPEYDTETIASAAVDRITERFGIEATGREYVKLYERLVR